jgi:transcription elongation factor GreA
MDSISILLDKIPQTIYTFCTLSHRCDKGNYSPEGTSLHHRGYFFRAFFMDQTHRAVLTPEGLDELKLELADLTQVKRPAAVKRLSDARDLGDLSENSEYAAAKQDLAFIDGRIAELEEIIHTAKVVTNHGKTMVDVGCHVTVHFNNKKEVFTVVGEWEADPMSKKISHSSPLGKALLGKKVGEKIEVDAPAGKLHYKILEIS